MKRRITSRRAQGTVIAEAPMMLWILFVILFLPLLNLATTMIRAGFLWSATHDSTIYAARALSYKNPISSSYPTAPALALQAAARAASNYSGISISSVQTAIVITNLTNLQQTIQTTALTSPADTSTNSYQIQVTLVGQAEPLYRYGLDWFGKVPGLTTAMQVSFTDRQFCENPQGLNI